MRFTVYAGFLALCLLAVCAWRTGANSDRDGQRNRKKEKMEEQIVELKTELRELVTEQEACVKPEVVELPDVLTDKPEQSYGSWSEERRALKAVIKELKQEIRKMSKTVKECQEGSPATSAPTTVAPTSAPTVPKPDWINRWNIAYNKLAYQSRSGDKEMFFASAAVDDDLTNSYVTGKRCAVGFPRVNDQIDKGWWQLDLGQVYEFVVDLYTENPVTNPQAAAVRCNEVDMSEPGVATGVREARDCSGGAEPARYVRVRDVVWGAAVQLCDFEVFTAEGEDLVEKPTPAVTTVALGKTATVSGGSTDANYAIDGDTNSDGAGGPGCVESAPGQTGTAWWQVDLGQTFQVYSVVITNRGDYMGKWLDYPVVTLHAEAGDAGTVCYSYGGRVPEGATITLICEGGVKPARWVKVTNGGPQKLQLCEVQVMA